MSPTRLSAQNRALWRNILRRSRVLSMPSRKEWTMYSPIPRKKSPKQSNLETITTIVTRYYDQDTWKENLIFEKSSFELLQDILESAGELEKRAPYEELVTTTYAEAAAK